MTHSRSRPPWWTNSRGEWYVIAQTVLFALVALGPAWIAIRLNLPESVRLVTLGVGLGLGMAGLMLAVAGLLGTSRYFRTPKMTRNWSRRARIGWCATRSTAA